MPPLLVCSQRGDARLVVLFDAGRAQQISLERRAAPSIVGNLYWGKVARVMRGMQAAFIDYGGARAGYLTGQDADPNGKGGDIATLLQPGTFIIVQATRDPVAAKGARLTCKLSLAGTFVALHPLGGKHALSRRLTDPSARTHLAASLADLAPPGMGLLGRTAAAGATRAQLQAEVQHLHAVWLVACEAAKGAAAPQLLHGAAGAAVQVVRDMAMTLHDIVTDDAALVPVLQQAWDAAGAPRGAKVRLHGGPVALWETHQLGMVLHDALARRVALPSGGNVTFDHTEALCVVDVNTGACVGRGSWPATLLQTNTEAAEAIAAHLRLRNIGGLVVIDFIDMDHATDREKVMHALHRALAADRTKVVLGPMSNFGLVELTRRHAQDNLHSQCMQVCPTCHGDGALPRLPG